MHMNVRPIYSNLDPPPGGSFVTNALCIGYERPSWIRPFLYNDDLSRLNDSVATIHTTFHKITKLKLCS